VQLYDVAILGFRLNAPEPPEKALVRVFRIEPEVARSMVRGFPLVVKRAVSFDVAMNFEAALVAIGARVELRASPQQAPESRPAPPPTQPTLLQHGFGAELVQRAQAAQGAREQQRFETVRELVAPALTRAVPQFHNAPARSAAPAPPGPAEALAGSPSTPSVAAPPARDPVTAYTLGELLVAPQHEAQVPQPATTAAADLQSFSESVLALEGPPKPAAPSVPEPAFEAWDVAPSSLAEIRATRAVAATAHVRGANLELADDGLPLELAVTVPPHHGLANALGKVRPELLKPPQREPAMPQPAPDVKGSSASAPTRAAPTRVEPAKGFAGDLSLPWLDPNVLREQSMRPPTNDVRLPANDVRLPEHERARSADAGVELAAEPRAPARTRAEALAVANAPSPFAVSGGPVPIPPPRELSAEVLAELPDHTEGLLRSLGLPALAVVLAVLSFGLGFSLTGVFFVLAAPLFGFSGRAYERTRQDLAGELEPLAADPSSPAELQVHGYDRWARHHGFTPLGLFLRHGSRELVGAFSHARVPAYLLVRLTPSGTIWEFLSLYERDQALITTGASYVLPPVPEHFRQAYPDATLQRLLTLHGEAHDFLCVHMKLQPLRAAPLFEDSFASFQHAREQALRSVPLWPAWLLPWRAVLPNQYEARPIGRSS
jgi:hypothetical protein